MKKTIAYLLSAVIGICLGIAVHCTFMIVEADGCLMLPTIEPNRNILINLLDKDVEEGDIIALKTQYYTLDGEGNIVFRRVESIEGEYLSLACDAKTVKDGNMKILEEEILGKVIFPRSNRR